MARQLKRLPSAALHAAFLTLVHKLYVELKNILARQPGPEVAEQLSVYQQVRVRVGGTQPLLVKPRPYLNLDP